MTRDATNQGQTGLRRERALLSADEVATLLSISIRHVHKLNVSERLPRPLRLGRAVRWRRDELLAWLAAGAPSRARWETMQN